MAGMHVAPVGSGAAWGHSGSAGGGTGLQIRSHLGGHLLCPSNSPGGGPPARQTANVPANRDTQRRRGHSPAGQSCYEEQDGTDVQFIPEVADVQERHLPEPELVGVIEELSEDTGHWGLAGITIVARAKGHLLLPRQRGLPGRGQMSSIPGPQWERSLRQGCCWAALSPPSDQPQPCSTRGCVCVLGAVRPLSGASQLPPDTRTPRGVGPWQPWTLAAGWVGQTVPWVPSGEGQTQEEGHM